MTFGSLFAGIGGFDLGLERAGMECRWQVEIDPYCQRVLAKHWPNVPRWNDVRTWPQPSTERVDVICGGFPCQDISTANPKREGLTGSRSGLWSEFRRVIEIMEPRVVIVENVPNLSVLGLDQVLGDFANLGFDAEWATLQASAFGAPQPRRRMFIIAHPMRERWPVLLRDVTGARDKADAWGEWKSYSPASSSDVLQAVEQSVGQPSVLGSSDGITSAVDRLRVTGNAVVPTVAEYIGRRILEAAA
jgi:DNA (cytosine-5)-methyltransferase 1